MLKKLFFFLTVMLGLSFCNCYAVPGTWTFEPSGGGETISGRTNLTITRLYVYPPSSKDPKCYCITGHVDSGIVDVVKKHMGDDLGSTELGRIDEQGSNACLTPQAYRIDVFSDWDTVGKVGNIEMDSYTGAQPEDRVIVMSYSNDNGRFTLRFPALGLFKGYK